jgi:hypothetical protein
MGRAYHFGLGFIARMDAYIPFWFRIACGSWLQRPEVNGEVRLLRNQMQRVGNETPLLFVMLLYRLTGTSE